MPNHCYVPPLKFLNLAYTVLFKNLAEIAVYCVDAPIGMFVQQYLAGKKNYCAKLTMCILAFVEYKL